MRTLALLCLFLLAAHPLAVRCLEQQTALEPPLLRHTPIVVRPSALVEQPRTAEQLPAGEASLLEVAALPKHHTEQVIAIQVLADPPAAAPTPAPKPAEPAPAAAQGGAAATGTTGGSAAASGTAGAAGGGATAGGPGPAAAPAAGETTTTTTTTTTSTTSFVPTAPWAAFLPQSRKTPINEFRPVKDKQPWDVIWGDLFLKLLAAHIRKRTATSPSRDLSRVDWRPCPELGTLPRLFVVRPRKDAVCDGSSNRRGVWQDTDGKVLRNFSPTGMKISLQDYGMRLPASSMDISLLMEGQGAQGEDVVAGHISEKIDMGGLVLPQISHVSFSDCRGQPAYRVEEHVMRTQYGGQRLFVTYKITDAEGNLAGRTEMLQLSDNSFDLYDQHAVKIATVTRSAQWDVSRQPKFCGEASWTIEMAPVENIDHSTLSAPENRWVVAALVTVKAVWDQQRDATGQTHTWMWTSLLTYTLLFLVLPVVFAVLAFTLGNCFKKPLYAWLCWVEDRLLPKTPFKNSRYIEPITG